MVEIFVSRKKSKLIPLSQQKRRMIKLPELDYQKAISESFSEANTYYNDTISRMEKEQNKHVQYDPTEQSVGFSDECGSLGMVHAKGIKANTKVGKELKKFCETTKKCYFAKDYFSPHFELSARSPLVQCINPKKKALQKLLEGLEKRNLKTEAFIYSHED